MHRLYNNNLAPVTWHGFTPVGAGYNLEIDGNGDIIRAYTLAFQYFGESRAGGTFDGFVIYKNLHNLIV